MSHRDYKLTGMEVSPASPLDHMVRTASEANADDRGVCIAIPIKPTIIDGKRTQILFTYAGTALGMTKDRRHCAILALAVALRLEGEIYDDGDPVEVLHPIRQGGRAVHLKVVAPVHGREGTFIEFPRWRRLWVVLLWLLLILFFYELAEAMAWVFR